MTTCSHRFTADGGKTCCGCGATIEVVMERIADLLDLIPSQLTNGYVEHESRIRWLLQEVGILKRGFAISDAEARARAAALVEKRERESSSKREPGP